jgi:tripartite-type tricarboxylate transporter receptor subunit TctC
VQVYFAPISASVEYIRAGKLRALAVTTAGRAEALPEIPIVGDFVAGYETSALYGIGAPKNTPVGIIDILNREISAALARGSKGRRGSSLLSQSGRGAIGSIGWRGFVGCKREPPRS